LYLSTPVSHSADCRCASEGMSLMIVGW